MYTFSLSEELRSEFRDAETSTKAAAKEGDAFVGVVSLLSLTAGTGTIECEECAVEFGSKDVQCPTDHLSGIQVAA